MLSHAFIVQAAEATLTGQKDPQMVLPTTKDVGEDPALLRI
jgi:hypothetical protein